MPSRSANSRRLSPDSSLSASNPAWNALRKVLPCAAWAAFRRQHFSPIADSSQFQTQTVPPLRRSSLHVGRPVNIQYNRRIRFNQERCVRTKKNPAEPGLSWGWTGWRRQSPTMPLSH